MTSSDLATLTLGAPAAERDIAEGLADYFVESETYRRVTDGPKRILIGNRGTGKSAIFKVLAARRRADDFAVVELAPEDYSYEMLTRALAGEAEGAWAKYGAYAVAWKYLVYIMVMRAVVGDARRIRRGALGRIQRYLRDQHGDSQGSKLSLLVAYLKRLESIKLGPIDGVLRLRQLESMYKLDEIAPLIEDLRECLAQRPVVVLVDELDRGWDASEDAKAFVAGLFQACSKLNELTPDLKVYMSLRQELYESIPALYEDAQKVRDIIETITWNEAMLLRLVANRIRYRVESFANATDEECWGHVFSEHMVSGHGRSFAYVVDRTLYRPREVIELCARAIELAQDAPPNAFPIDYPLLSAAEVAYSKARVDDITAEYSFQLPDLASVFNAFRASSGVFDRSELEQRCLEIAIGERPTSNVAHEWLKDKDPDSLIDTLFRVGFLKARSVRRAGTGEHATAEYLGSYQVRNLNVSGVAEFRVHPMFRAFLGIDGPEGH